jgi:hypothetical protein
MYAGQVERVSDTPAVDTNSGSLASEATYQRLRRALEWDAKGARPCPVSLARDGVA